MIRISVSRFKGAKAFPITERPYRDIIEYLIHYDFRYDEIPSSDFFEASDFLKACKVGQPDCQLYFSIDKEGTK